MTTETQVVIHLKKLLGQKQNRQKTLLDEHKEKDATTVYCSSKLWHTHCMGFGVRA